MRTTFAILFLVPVVSFLSLILIGIAGNPEPAIAVLGFGAANPLACAAVVVVLFSGLVGFQMLED